MFPRNQLAGSAQYPPSSVPGARLSSMPEMPASRGSNTTRSARAPGSTGSRREVCPPRGAGIGGGSADNEWASQHFFNKNAAGSQRAIFFNLISTHIFPSVTARENFRRTPKMGFEIQKIAHRRREMMSNPKNSVRSKISALAG